MVAGPGPRSVLNFELDICEKARHGGQDRKLPSALVCVGIQRNSDVMAYNGGRDQDLDVFLH